MSRCSSTPAQRAQRIVQQLVPRTVSSSTSTDDDASFVSPLESERASPAFPVRELTYYLDGGEAVTQIKEMVQMAIEADGVLNDSNRFDLTREEARERSMAKIAQVVATIRSRSEDAAAAAAEKSKNGSGSNSKDQKLFDASLGDADDTDDRSRAGTSKTFENAFYGCLSTLDPSWAIRIGVHFGLFQSAILGSGTEEQIAAYAKDVLEMRIIGCFAMTEMGHGSYVGGLETTATYDVATQEFVIHSPTLTSTKWWIGLAGQTATHSAVFARLVVGGVDRGVQTFVVPLRDLATGLPVPNVSVGDMGSKMGRNGLDNGWIRFEHLRVPRSAMLMRWAQVSPEGVYSPPPSKQVAYNALIGTRVELFATCATVLKKALTIAIRYSLVRRQFPRKDVGGGAGKEEETKLLDYPTHQAVLFPILAHTFALHFAAGATQSLSEVMLRAKDLSGNLAALPELHATSSGLKAMGTWYANEAIENCRQTLGGLGYSSYAGLGAVRADWAVMCTWEGDNTVLSLQCARFLLKQASDLVERGKTPRGVARYIAEFDPKARAPQSPPWRDPTFQIHALRHRAARKIREVSRLVSEETRRKEGCSYEVAAQRLSVECMAVTKMHCYAFMLQCFNEGVTKAPKELQPVLALSVRRRDNAMRSLRDLFALGHMESNLGDFLEDDYLVGGQVPGLRGELRTLLTSLRPHALPLVDAFNIPDFVVDSPLGRADGNVYRKLFDVIRSAPGAQAVPSYFQTLIRPLTDPNYKPAATDAQ